jgi:hypothetical protein
VRGPHDIAGEARGEPVLDAHPRGEEKEVPVVFGKVDDPDGGDEEERGDEEESVAVTPAHGEGVLDNDNARHGPA